MAIQTSVPGVYIEEFTPGAPIEGVGTNTAALIGSASRGDLDTPTKITSWDQFKSTFGDEPVPGFYLWYAVRGFFENGGQVCYVVRASNGAYAKVTVNDQSSAPKPLFVVRARAPGKPDPVIQMTLSETPPTVSAPLYQPTATYVIDGLQAVVLPSADVAAQFRPGDLISLAAPDTRVEISSVSGRTIRFSTPLKGAIGSGSGSAIALADAPVGTRTFRLAPAKPLAPGVLVTGTMLTFTQPPSANPDTQIVDSIQVEQLATLPNPTTTYRVTLRQGLAIPISMSAAAAVTSVEFDVEIAQDTQTLDHTNLSMVPEHPRYYVDVINKGPGPVQVELIEPPPATRMPDNLPELTGVPLTGGVDEDLVTLGDSDYIDALDTLSNVDDVNLIAIPDRQSPAVQQALIAHCEQLADRFAVLDARAGLGPFTSGKTEGIDSQRLGLDSARGYAALYYPWLKVNSARGSRTMLVPPSGHMCGIIARSDANRGVHKAPANEIVNGALGLERTVSDAEQGQLNRAGINVIRIFQAGGRPTLWGARTTATDTNWLHVSTRRLFLYLEESIQEGIRWAVFEPNNKALWQKLKRTITDFLTRAWRDGALFGSKADEAFYVRIDDALNPFSEQALGRLHIEVGVRPVYPAEFIIVRIGIWPGGSEVSES